MRWERVSRGGHTKKQVFGDGWEDLVIVLGVSQHYGLWLGMLEPVFPFFYHKSHFWLPHLVSQSLQECFKTPS